MKPLEHTSALGWIIALSATGWLIAGLMVVVSMNTYSGPSPIAVGAAAFCLSIMLPSIVGAIVLHGVKQMLQQVREPEMLPERPAKPSAVESLQTKAEQEAAAPPAAPAEGQAPSVLPPQDGWTR
jgi:hypothetical protein